MERDVNDARRSSSGLLLSIVLLNSEALSRTSKTASNYCRRAKELCTTVSSSMTPIISPSHFNARIAAKFDSVLYDFQ